MHDVELPDREFHQLRELVYELSGIHLNDNKRALLQGRVARRLRHHDLRSFADYYALVREGGEEQVELVNCITTNKTDFFREPHHFDFLRARLFPELRARVADGATPRLRIWSAGCSTGEEPCSIAMTVRDHLGAEGWDVRILASDIDTAVLAHAERGVYTEERMAGVPAEARRRHFLRGVGASAGAWRARPELRAMIDFQRINLMAAWPVAGSFDAIFCRNVVIYFDQPTQRRIFRRFAERLAPESYLFVGHSESMIGISTDYSLIGPTVHRVGPAEAAPVSRRIGIGEVFASRAPANVSTVLGSCISACLFDPVARVGGMNHFLLPSTAGDAQQPARYGIHAMELLINEIMRLGGDRRRLQAKVVGASHVLDSLEGAVGLENSRFVREFLATERIPLVGERLGGKRPLEAHFETSTGRLRCREIVTESASAVAARERSYRDAQQRRLGQTEAGEDLF